MARSVRREDTLAGFWFLTLSVALLGPVLFAVVLVLDKASGAGGVFGSLVISPDSARTILGSVAGSLITIASLTVSLTIVTLQLLSNQYTPRAVRGFLRKRVSQVVSGGFIGVFVYCVLLLVAVREPGDFNAPFVPSLGVVVAIALSLLDLVLLVGFINSLAKTIQVSTMTSEVAAETISAIDVVHARTVEAAPDDEPHGPATELIHAEGTGYVRRTSVVDVGAPGAWRVEVLARPGDFVTRYQAVIRWTGTGALPSATRRALGRSVLIGSERDLDQDPSFGIRQLVDVALRALSPGINDPTTAVTCIGYLRWIYEHLASVELPAVRVVARVGDDGLVVQHGFTFEDYLAPVDEIASYALGDARVTVVLLQALAQVLDTCTAAGREDRSAVVRRLGATLVDRAEAAQGRGLGTERLAPLRARFEG